MGLGSYLSTGLIISWDYWFACFGIDFSRQTRWFDWKIWDHSFRIVSI